MAGLEVDAIEPVAGAFHGVIVAEIIEAEQHPDADKLRVCKVATGGDVAQIVCGAPNARVGLKAPLAQIGAVLPGDFKIKKAKLRGVESQGMLCAQAELGISDENTGLMELPADAPVGTDLREYLGLDDVAIEIGLTPNRADCLSICGIARDVAVLNDLPLLEQPESMVSATIDDTFPVAIEAPDHCPRYLGRVIRGVDLSRPTPLWMAERLRRAGLRSIDPVVDVTNYVMLELGQPLHAFDLDTLVGGIVVRESLPDETITLLDGSEQALAPGSLLIADHERPLALAGIMGGDMSGVSAGTQNVFLESAFFSPTPIAGRARRYGLHTDASHRYERGVDWQLQRHAAERTTQLLLDIVGGEPGPLVETKSEQHLPQPVSLVLRGERIERVLGVGLEASMVERILTGLGFEVKAEEPRQWLCTAPSWRFDMVQEVDLIEELARVWGYNQLPASTVLAPLVLPEQSEDQRSLAALRRQLVARGFYEAITFSFVAPKLQALFDPDTAPVALRNPISAELAVMRTSLIPGLLSVISHNLKRQMPRVRVFETGMRFLPGDSIHQEPMIAMAMTGTRDAENWTGEVTAVDFFDMKGEVEQLMLGVGAELEFRPSTRAGLHDGQTADIVLHGRVVGVMGAVHPSAAKQLDLPKNTYVAELMQSAVISATLPAFDDISRFPETRRDIAVLLAQDTPASLVLSTIRGQAGEWLKNLTIFDVYAGQGIPEGKKSLALGLTFRDPSRTLDDAEISSLMTQVIDSLEEKLGAELRS
jgi:phenylalanyl-tRNA synthetase beta chain